VHTHLEPPVADDQFTLDDLVEVDPLGSGLPVTSPRTWIAQNLDTGLRIRLTLLDDREFAVVGTGQATPEFVAAGRSFVFRLSDGGNPTRDAPAGMRFSRRWLNVDAPPFVGDCMLELTVDDDLGPETDAFYLWWLEDSLGEMRLLLAGTVVELAPGATATVDEVLPSANAPSKIGATVRIALEGSHAAFAGRRLECRRAVLSEGPPLQVVGDIAVARAMVPESSNPVPLRCLVLGIPDFPDLPSHW